MSQIPPLTYTVVQNIQAQRQVADEKSASFAARRPSKKNLAAQEDELEHQVESAEEVEPIHDQNEKQQHRSKRRPHARKDDDEDDTSHIDLTA